MFLYERIQMMEVVVMARMVPMGMDFWASCKSPDRFDPAMIPVQNKTEHRMGRMFPYYIIPGYFIVLITSILKFGKYRLFINF